MKRFATRVIYLGLIEVAAALAVMLHSYYFLTIPMAEMTEQDRINEASDYFAESAKRGRVAANLAWAGAATVIIGIGLRSVASSPDRHQGKPKG